jgi:hypothetical protein
MRTKLLNESLLVSLVLTACLVGTSPGQLIYQEGFNDDGDGTRYTMEGRGFELAADGPAIWEHNFNAPQIGLATAAPAKRAALLWTHEAPFSEDFEQAAFDLWTNLVDWATDGQENATIGFFPGHGVNNVNFDSVFALGELFEEQGHTVIDIATAEELPAPEDLDLLIHTSEINPAPVTAFTNYAVPMITFNADNHDDSAVAQIGASLTFPDAFSLNVVEENADHPVLAGLSDPLPFVNFPLTVPLRTMGNPAPGASVLLTYTHPDTGAEQPALAVIEEGGALIGSFGPEPEGTGFIVGASLDDFITEVNPKALQLNPVDISGQSDVMLSVALAATNADFEPGDYLRIMVGQDGDPIENFTILSEYLGVDDPGGPFNKALSRDAGETGLSSQAFEDITWNISELAPNITDLVVRFEAINTFPNEIIAFDNVRIFAGDIGGGGIPGDYNNNGTVEQADLDLVLLNWGADGTTPPNGWTNNLPEGTIDQAELDGVLLNWGNTAALGVASGVPEPGTQVLLVLAIAAMFARRRRC